MSAGRTDGGHGAVQGALRYRESDLLLQGTLNCSCQRPPQPLPCQPRRRPASERRPASDRRQRETWAVGTEEAHRLPARPLQPPATSTAGEGIIAVAAGALQHAMLTLSWSTQPPLRLLNLHTAEISAAEACQNIQSMSSQ
jgi:hypothetical protein